jgi:orotate phosphoribosyltransferase
MVHVENLHSLLQEVRDAGIITDGHFAFRSGMHALCLLDRDRLLSDTHLASRMGYAIAKHFFLSRADLIATPSVWGAGLAQWVGFFLDPRRPVVYPTPTESGVMLSQASADAIDGKRVLVIDNLILTGRTIQEFVREIGKAGGTPIGIGALADLSGISFPIQVFGLLNGSLEIYRPEECPACRAGEPVTEVGY